MLKANVYRIDIWYRLHKLNMRITNTWRDIIWENLRRFIFILVSIVDLCGFYLRFRRVNDPMSFEELSDPGPNDLRKQMCFI